mgnify:CR=1 FL=1
MFNSFKKNKALKIYTKIAKQSREPFFFKDCKIEDTFHQRLEILSLNLIIILWSMKKKNLFDLSQKLIDIFFQDLDNSLRELGVSDLSVGKKIKILAENFFGRLASYSDSIERSINENKKSYLRTSIKKNFNYKQKPKIECEKILKYALRNIELFKNINEDKILNVSFEFIN